VDRLIIKVLAQDRNARQAEAFQVLAREKALLKWMSVGSILGAAIGGLLLGLVPTTWLMGLLGVILLVSAVKTFQHAH